MNIHHLILNFITMNKTNATSINAEAMYENTSSFEKSMFLINPNRAVIFADFMGNISQFGELKVKLLGAMNTKDVSFALAVDAYEKAT